MTLRLPTGRMQVFDKDREHNDLVFPHQSALGRALVTFNQPLPQTVYEEVFQATPSPPPVFGFEEDVWEQTRAVWDPEQGVYEGEQGMFYYTAHHPLTGLDQCARGEAPGRKTHSPE